MNGGMMHALEMELDDDEDDDEVRFLPHTNNGHHNHNHRNISRSLAFAAQQNNTRQMNHHRHHPSSPDSRSRSWQVSLLIVTVLMLWLLSYRVDLFSMPKTNTLHTPQQTGTTTDTLSSPASAAADAPSYNNKGSRAAESTTPTATTSTTSLLYSSIATIVPDPYHAHIDQSTRDEVAKQYGKWHFWDGDQDTRPVGDYCAAFAHRDVPGDDFPDTAWQMDAVYVNHLLDDAEQLIGRTMEAIYTEYGWGKPQTPAGLSERLQLYKWTKIADDRMVGMTAPPSGGGGGGWTTLNSYDGLVRRLLHAMMTNDVFTVVLAGHSAAAGHGNHFHQAYMHQFHKIVAPVLARMGVKLVTRNLSQGGLGTIQNALGMQDLYGSEIDLLLWDSGMTETDPADIDFFFRQGLLSGHRVPVIWGGDWETLQNLHDHADADIGFFNGGNGMDAIPQVTSAEQAQTLPFAARFLKCAPDVAHLCTENRFCATCWIDRLEVSRTLFDHISPTVPSQVRWHPGWRWHQLKGRVLAMSILDALQVAVQRWSDGTMGGPPLDDGHWHVGNHYNNIREKVKKTEGACYRGIEPRLPKRICDIAMHGRSLFTPRANPHETSLLTLLKPAPNGYIPKNKNKVLYTGQDVHNTCDDIPQGAIDVLLVASNRRQLATTTTTQSNADEESTTTPQNETYTITTTRTLGDEAIVPGIGWEHRDEYPGNCDGTYNAICGRHKSHTCPLIGHHDSRGHLVGNEYSGWLVFEIPEIKEGLVIIKIMTGFVEEDNTITKGWKGVNNERDRGLRAKAKNDNPNSDFYSTSVLSDTDYVDGEFKSTTSDSERRLDLNGLPDTFFFDYAINGKITSLDKKAFLDAVKNVQRVVEVVTLLDDPAFGQQEKVEVAIRMRGCGRVCTFGVSHLYWA